MSIRQREQQIYSLIIVNGKTSVCAGELERSLEGREDERQIGNQGLPGTIRSDRRPITFVLNALKRGHAIRNAVSNNLVHNVPGRNRSTHALDFRLDVLRDNRSNHLGGGEAPRQPRLDGKVKCGQKTGSAYEPAFVNARMCCGHGKCC